MENIIEKLDEIIKLLGELNGDLRSRDTTSLIPALAHPIPRRQRKNANGTESAALIKSYCDAFKERYGTSPIIEGKTAGLAGYVLQAIPLERAQDLVQTYLQMSDKWFLTQHHNFSCFAQNMSKVAVALAGGSEKPEDKLFWQTVFGNKDARTRVPNTNKALTE